MDILYPLPSLTSPEVARESSVTVLINHVVDRDDRRGFLDALKGFLEEFEKFAGTMGCKVFEQEEGGKVRVTMLQRFDSARDHEAWLK